MLTGMGKIGYLLAYSGFVALTPPVVGLANYPLNSFTATLIVIGTVMLVGGSILLWRDRTARSLRWKFLWTHTVLTDRDKGAYYLIIFGSFGLSWLLSLFSWDVRSEIGLWFIAVTSIALVIGWLLALSEFLPSRSAQK